MSTAAMQVTVYGGFLVKILTLRGLCSVCAGRQNPSWHVSELAPPEQQITAVQGHCPVAYVAGE